jgi:hypothetical protein
MSSTTTNYHARQLCICLCDEGGGGGALVPPGRGEGTDGLVVTGKLVNVSLCFCSPVEATYAVNTRLDENEAELAVLVLAVGLEMLADGNGLLDQHVEVLGDVRAKACAICQPEPTRCLFDIALQMLPKSRAASTCAFRYRYSYRST